ncbi:MAG: FCD domain-containing protein [Thermoleophilaceae bacterium]
MAGDTPSRSAFERPDAVRRPPKTAVVVAHALGERIATLSPGDMLAPERDLIAEFQIGRGTLREALRLLELLGVISVKAGPRGGPVVLRPDHRPLVDVLSLFLQATEAPYKQVIQARRAIEAELARLAATHATDEDIAELRASTETMAERVGDEAFFRAENMRFHEICSNAARNAVLAVFHSTLKAISDGHAIGVTYSRRQQSAVVAAHERIVEALEARDPEASFRAMDAHMGEFEDYIQRRYREVASRPVRWLLPS